MGQGREAAKKSLKENSNLCVEIEAKIREKVTIQKNESATDIGVTITKDTSKEKEMVKR